MHLIKLFPEKSKGLPDGNLTSILATGGGDPGVNSRLFKVSSILFSILSISAQVTERRSTDGTGEAGSQSSLSSFDQKRPDKHHEWDTGQWKSGRKLSRAKGPNLGRAQWRPRPPPPVDMVTLRLKVGGGGRRPARLPLMFPFRAKDEFFLLIGSQLWRFFRIFRFELGWWWKFWDFFLMIFDRVGRAILGSRVGISTGFFRD